MVIIGQELHIYVINLIGTPDAEHQPLSSSPQSGNKGGSTPPQTITPPPSLNSSFNAGTTNAANRSLLGLTPSDEVVFDINNNAGQNNGLQAKLQIRNISNKSVVFKVILPPYLYIRADYPPLCSIALVSSTT